MRKWEYFTDYSLERHDLDRLGSQGWELITIQRDYKTSRHWFYFKREITD